ncbi:MAG: hypothetical protein ABH883_05725 [Candidatus Omnitrophota bacterium]
MNVRIFDSITGVDEKEWDSIVGRDRLICRHKYLEAVEKADVSDCEYFYPVVYENGKIAAHTCAYYISTELDLFAVGFVKTVIKKASEKYGKDFWSYGRSNAERR